MFPKDWYNFKFSGEVDKNGYEVRTLYIYWVDTEWNNYLVGKITEQTKPFTLSIYTMEYIKEGLDYCREHFDYFDRMAWCPFDKGDKFVFEGFLPFFITERTPNENREDLPQLLADAEMVHYDRFEYLRRTRGATGGNRFFVHESDNAIDYAGTYMHMMKL